MKTFIIAIALLGVVYADFNQQLLDRAYQIRQNAKPALEYLQNNGKIEEAKTLKTNLDEMNVLYEQMKQDSFRELPIYEMETKMLATERAVVYETRQALFHRTHDIVKSAEAIVGKLHDEGIVRKITEQIDILKELFEKMNDDVDYDQYIETQRVTIEHQEKLLYLIA